MPSSNEAKQQLSELLPRLARSPRDEALWEQLYQNVWRFIYVIAFRILRAAPEQAHDATQNTFLRVFRYCDFADFSDPDEFLAYLSTIARHSALDLKKEEGTYITGLEIVSCDLVSGAATPEQVERIRQEFGAVLDELSAEERKLADLLMAGRNLTEIAAELKVKYPAAAVRVHRFRQKLANRLKQK
jgi:RNA polymerase sigma factor (sigma-70 family)